MAFSLPRGDAVFSGTGSIAVEAAIAAWRFDHFGTTANAGNAADGADPNGDGENNFYEFSTDTDSTDKSTTTWTYAEDDLDWAGDSTRRPDGSTKGSYLVKYQGDDYVTIATDLAYDGAGTGTETWHRTGDVCNTTFYADGVCERDCSGDCYTEP